MKSQMTPILWELLYARHVSEVCQFTVLRSPVQPQEPDCPMHALAKWLATLCLSFLICERDVTAPANIYWVITVCQALLKYCMHTKSFTLHRKVML